MFSCKIIVSVLFLFFIAKTNSDENYLKATTGSNDFDVLIFTQHWPQTVCYTWKENQASHTCSLPTKHDEWTIHGIWPSQYHKIGPQFCNKSMPFNPSALKSIETELQEKWIDIENGKTSYSLWKHEWDKHGTCAATVEHLNSEVKYFKEGLNLLTKYDMKNVLAQENIIPGQTYNTSDILNAIERILGKRGSLICIKSKDTGESYIFEIRICFDKMLQLINCDETYEYPTNCDLSGYVTYPDKLPQGHNVAQKLQIQNVLKYCLFINFWRIFYNRIVS
ncbi:ribonuclease Oy isoform X1 [Bombus huntii]|uniref:ribonuclease Oy isoform X1 n=1 Tax=Bombus huntii TaxID=85661 RepID=UPI0021A99169|nr:ribonuclease Oy isoform X1 [Bombus huntii]